MFLGLTLTLGLFQTGVLGEADSLNNLSGKINTNMTQNIKSGNVSIFNMDANQVLNDASAMGLNTVTVPIEISIDSLTSNTSTIVGLDKTLFLARTLIAKKYAVIIEPFPYIANGTAVETDLNPTDKTAFLENWSANLQTISKAIENDNIYGMYIGSNFVNLETESVEFNNIITALRNTFKGKIIYRTNWWYTATWDTASQQQFESKTQTPFFKNLDILAISNYFEVSDPDAYSVSELIPKLNNTDVYNRGQAILDQINELHNVTGKPIIFGELGITNYTGAMAHPYQVQYPEGTPINNNIQTVWFNTWISTMSQYQWFKGFSLFAIGDPTSEFYPNAQAQTYLNSIKVRKVQ